MACADLEITDSTGAVPAAGMKWLHDSGRAALVRLGVEGAISARIVDDPEMCRAHGRYDGQFITTDVLTFDYTTTPRGAPHGGPDAPHLGFEKVDERSLDVEIIVCRDVAEREAAGRGYPLERELLLYLLHGVLHCLGYDDRDDEAAARMHEVEDQLLESIGVGATFRTPEGTEGSG